MSSNAQKVAALGLLAGAAVLLWRYFYPPGQVEIIDGATLDNSPLQNTFDTSPIWGTPSIDIFDTEELLFGTGLNMGTASAGGAGFVAKKWVTPAIGLQFENLFVASSKKHGIPDGVLSRIAMQESTYRAAPPPNKGPANMRGVPDDQTLWAWGLMQIVPKLAGSSIEVAKDPARAVDFAASLLRSNYKVLKRWDAAVVAYNQGSGNVKKAIADKGENWVQSRFIGPTGKKYYQVAMDTGLVPSAIGVDVGRIA